MFRTKEGKITSQKLYKGRNGICFFHSIIDQWLILNACICACTFNHVWLFVTPWTVARQAPLSVGFSRQEYWSGMPFPPPGDIPDPGIEPEYPAFPSLEGMFFTSWATREALIHNAAAAAKSLQSCPTLCDPIDGSPPGSPVPGILQARTVEWVSISFSNAWK